MSNYSNTNLGNYNKITSKKIISNLILNRTDVKTSNYTITEDDCIVAYNTSGGTFTITMPDATSIQTGQYFIVKDEGGSASVNNLTIDTTSSQTIDGNLTITVNGNYDSLKIYSNGSNWFLT